MQVIPVLGGRYRLGPVIASGGMGAVHRAWDERFGREVAIKVVHSGAEEVEHERLRREAQYLAGLDHPNLVAVLDAGSDRLRHRTAVWFAMELVQGPDLRRLLQRDGALDGAAVRRILGSLLAALDALHTAGVVHRDLKPANVLLTAEPSTGRWDVKLVDLGIAQHVRTEHLTSTGQVVGTAAYLSPEQIGGGRIGPATDVYALGLLAIEALTGRVAFPGAVRESAVARLVRAPELPAALDPSWRALLTGMTALDPADRPPVRALLETVGRLPQSAVRSDEQLGALELAATQAIDVADAPTRVQDLATARIATIAPAARPRSRRRLLATACALLVLIGAGGGVAALAGAGKPTAAAATVPASAPAPTLRTPAAVRTTPPPAPTPVAVVTTPAPREEPTKEERKQAAAARKRTERQREQAQEVAGRLVERLRNRWKHAHDED